MRHSTLSRKIGISSKVLLLLASMSASQVSATDYYSYDNTSTPLTFTSAGNNTSSNTITISTLPIGGYVYLVIGTQAGTAVQTFTGNYYNTSSSISFAHPTTVYGGSNGVALNGYIVADSAYNQFIITTGSSSVNITHLLITDNQTEATTYYNSINSSYQQSQNVSVSSINTTATNANLVQSAYSLNAILNQQDLVMKNTLNYDCNQFGENGMCVAAGVSYTSVVKDKTEAAQTGINLRAAKKINDNLRVGFFLDKGLQGTVPISYKITSANPIAGIFVGYSQNQDGLGLNVKASAGTGSMYGTTLHNGVTQGTVAGDANTEFTTKGAQLQMGYAQQASKTFKYEPYLGIRTTQEERSAYTENDSSFSIAYAKYSHTNTTTFAGAKFDNKVSDKITAKADISVEMDTQNNYSQFKATYLGSTQGVVLNAGVLPEAQKTRLVANVGADYALDKTSKVNLSAYEQPINIGTAVGASFTYTKAF
jgi:Autotransporter beta-domain